MITKTFVRARRYAVLPLALMIVSACGATQSDGAPPDWLIGKYHYSGNGTIAKRFPWDAKADLVLDRDKQYTLKVTVHINDDEGGDTDEDESYGTYYVSGDRLVLQPVDGDEETFDIHGRKLVPRIGWPARMALKGMKIGDPVFVKSE